MPCLMQTRLQWLTELQNALASAARVFELIDEEPQIPDAPDAAVLSEVKGEVSLSDVNFSYDPEIPLIENMNLEVKPGQRVAIVGPTGCGKSTVINLLMRFYDVDSGSIQVDGNDVREITRKSLRTAQSEYNSMSFTSTICRYSSLKVAERLIANGSSS